MMELTDNTHQYIVVHQASLRNRVSPKEKKQSDRKVSQIMWLSVLMEGSLIATCAGALIASTFGMNLSSGAQESSQVSFHSKYCESQRVIPAVEVPKLFA